MVEDCHEFVASGVIVHNCVWALWDLMVKGGHAGSISAAGFGSEPEYVSGDIRRVGKKYIDQKPR